MTPAVWRLAGYFLDLGATGFGGPIALVGYMQRDLVERRGWVSQREYAEGLAFSQLAPGPLAAQLAIYLGWVRGGAAGATVTGAAFLLPSFVMVLALSVAYVRFGGLPWMRGAFYGIGAAAIAVIARGAVRLATLTLRRDRTLWAVALVNAAVVVVAQVELVGVLVASGALVAGLRSAGERPGRGVVASLAALPLLSVGTTPLLELFWFFIKAGAVVFGSGLAIVPFLYGAVEQHGWLTEREFLDAVAVSLITPGPVVITVAFIGYLTAGLAGAILAAAGVFLPVYLSVLLFAPSFERIKARPGVRAFVDGVTAAASGALAGAAVVLGQRAIPDAGALLLAVGAFALLVALRRIPDVAVMLAAGAAGVVLA
ncbi:MAG: chromate efflux transporter [Gemmatimonadales bacterium]